MSKTPSQIEDEHRRIQSRIDKSDRAHLKQPPEKPMQAGLVAIPNSRFQSSISRSLARNTGLTLNRCTTRLIIVGPRS